MKLFILITSIMLAGSLFASDDVKIVVAGDEAAVILPSREALVVPKNEADRFIYLLKSKNWQDSDFQLVNKNKLQDKKTGEAFSLEKPTYQNQWYVSQGTVNFYYLQEVSNNDLIELVSTDQSNKKKFYFEPDYPNHGAQMDQWKPGDSILIVQVLVRPASQSQWFEAGNQLFRFKSPTLTLDSFAVDSSEQGGIWVHKEKAQVQ